MSPALSDMRPAKASRSNDGTQEGELAETAFAERLEEVEKNAAQLRDFSEQQYQDALDAESTAAATIAAVTAAAAVSPTTQAPDTESRPTPKSRFAQLLKSTSAPLAGSPVTGATVTSDVASGSRGGLHFGAKSVEPLVDPIFERGATKTRETLRFEDWQASQINVAPSYRAELVQRNLRGPNAANTGAGQGVHQNSSWYRGHRQRYTQLQQRYGLSVTTKAAEKDFVAQVLNRLLNFSLPDSQAVSAALVALDYDEYLDIPYISAIPRAKTISLNGIGVDDVIVAWQRGPNHEFIAVPSAAAIEDQLRSYMAEADDDQTGRGKGEAEQSAAIDARDECQMRILLHDVRNTTFHCGWRLHSLTDSNGKYFQQEKMLFVKLRFQDHVTQIQAQQGLDKPANVGAAPTDNAAATSDDTTLADSSGLGNSLGFVFDLSLVNDDVDDDGSGSERHDELSEDYSSGAPVAKQRSRLSEYSLDQVGTLRVCVCVCHLQGAKSDSV